MALRGRKVLLLGMAYKAGTSDWRESPSIIVARKLAEFGAELSYADPHVPVGADLGVDAARVDFGADSLAASDLVVVLVDHKEFDADTIAAHSPLVFDAKAMLRGHDINGEVL